MSSILLIGPDPEIIEVLKLRLEVDGHEVITALGKDDSLSMIRHAKPMAAVIDMIGYDADELREIEAITNVLSRTKVRSVLLLPRGLPADIATCVRFPQSKKAEKTSEYRDSTEIWNIPKNDLVVRKPYDLNKLIKEIYRLINNPKTSLTSRRDPRRQS